MTKTTKNLRIFGVSAEIQNGHTFLVLSLEVTCSVLPPSNRCKENGKERGGIEKQVVVVLLSLWTLYKVSRSWLNSRKFICRTHKHTHTHTHTHTERNFSGTTSLWLTKKRKERGSKCVSSSLHYITFMWWTLLCFILLCKYHNKFSYTYVIKWAHLTTAWDILPLRMKEMACMYEILL